MTDDVFIRRPAPFPVQEKPKEAPPAPKKRAKKAVAPKPRPKKANGPFVPTGQPVPGGVNLSLAGLPLGQYVARLTSRQADYGFPPYQEIIIELRVPLTAAERFQIEQIIMRGGR